MSRFAIVLPLIALLISCAALPMITSPAVADLAPTGKTRAAINFGNPILASKDPVTGEARGRDAGAQYLRNFVATMKSSGFVAEALKRHGIEGVAVAQ